MSTQETGPANSTPVKSHVPDLHTPSQLASSSSPSLSASTMASSVIKGPKEPLDEAMEVDSDDDVEIVGDAEVAVLESRNGSPVVGKGSKRKSADSKPLPESKKAKTTKAKADAPTSKKTVAKEKAAPALVQLRGSKFTLNQKPLNWMTTSSSMRGQLNFTDDLAGLVKASPVAYLSEWPEEHWGVVGRLVHETDKSLSILCKHVRAQLVEVIEGSTAAGEDSQEMEENAFPTKDRIPVGPLKDLIESLATRTNYGLDLSDLSGVPEGVTEIPAGLQIWRWEINDFALLPTELEAKLLRRKEERVEAKTLALELFLALSEEERLDVLTKSKKGATAAAKVAKEDSEPKASGSGESKKVKAVVDPAEAEAKAALKAEKAEKAAEKIAEKALKGAEKAVKEAEKEADKAVKDAEKAVKEQEKAAKDAERAIKKAVRDKLAAEKDEKKAKKDKEAAEKKAKEDKKKSDISKQSGVLAGFFVKKEKASSPAPALIIASPAGTPAANKSSDFNKVFHPFHIKSDVVVAPINRFVSSRKIPDVAFNSLPSLNLKESLESFLAKVPKHRIPHYNPYPKPPVSIREIVSNINDCSVTGTDPKVYHTLLANRSKVQVKFLKFHLDVRPGYVGTWTKTSRVVGPRTPFGQDTALVAYEYDSEAEWEEEVEGDGDDLDSTGSRSEDEKDDEDDDEEDWMCEDDEVDYLEGYDGDMEMKVDPDDDPDCIVVDVEGDARRKKERRAKAAKEGARKKAAGLLLPSSIGPMWEKDIGKGDYAPFEALYISCINNAYYGVDPFTFDAKFEDVAAAPAVVASGSTPSAANLLVPKPKKVAKPLADVHLSTFIRLVHGSELSRTDVQKLVKEELKTFNTTLVSIEATFKELGVTRVKKMWAVPAEMREKYGVDV